jgi:hypothetical protein
MFTTTVDTLNRCIEFLAEIGITVSWKKLEGPCFLPGLSIENGAIIIDKDALKYPGDILHEAGHIAVVPAAERATLSGTTIDKRLNNKAEEMMAIAWSYAACVHLDIDPGFVFHDDGYKGGGSYIVDNFREKKYFGLPMLQWTGMAIDPKNAIKGQPAYPDMIKWLRD